MRKIIQPGECAYASPIVLACKKSGEIRLRADHRELNKIMMKNSYPTQLIENNLDQLQVRKFYTRLNLRNGFHHIRMTDTSIKYAAFITPIGQYEYLLYPVGHENGRNTFIRLIEEIFTPLIHAKC